MMCCLVLDPAGRHVPGAVNHLEAVARACSPRVESCGANAVMFDATGLDRVIGPPDVLAAEVARLVSQRNVPARIAVAATQTAAWLLAHARAGTTVVAARTEAAALAPLPIGVLSTLGRAGTRDQALGTRDRLPAAPAVTKLAPNAQSLDPGSCAQCLTIFIRWGLQTLGDLARLPRAELHTRLGPPGVCLHQAASGEDTAPLVPAAEPPRFAERVELEWPIEGLEPLSFVLARLCDALSDALERADRGAVAITTRLRLVTRETHERTLTLPAPMRDARVLRTLILLDLESHAPSAAIDIVELELDVTPGRIVQGSLIAHTLPSPEDLTTLVARLNALMGESRVGAPVLVDSHDERAVAMKPFRVNHGSDKAKGTRQNQEELLLGPAAFCLSSGLRPCLRRFRLPIVARVIVDGGAPARVLPAARGLPDGNVVAAAGPWRTSGRWWEIDRMHNEARGFFYRDHWDVEVADGSVYRLARDRTTGRWEIEGIFD